ncbi:uncharacterized protein LOC126846466 [Adelges cooleyi]|uniref:uncharacterized protein LOC126846466 n=1 Tax=Adelges cooleyi TaxID=133065 RepID=UPI00217F3288|nr:uncharacterized protein LOC126846466 [Adelges cooleyi]
MDGDKSSDHILILNRIDCANVFKSPLKATQRIRYTSFDVSQNFIIFGASSGGLYVFQRQPCEFIQLLPNKEGSVTQVLLSKDEELIGFGTQKGIVCILQRNDNGIGAKMLNKSTEHLGHEITAMEWTSKNQLYFGDNSGKVTSICVSLFVRKAIFQTPPYTMIQLDSKVVQMNSSDDLLVVSTLTRCYVCDIVKEQYKQIGQKPRDGDYGCCIVEWKEKKIFSARPGSRIWEVEINGTVQSTHQLKYCLAIPPTLNVHDSMTIDFSRVSSENWPPQSLNFKKLCDIWNNCILTFTSNSIFIINMLTINIVLWYDGYSNIQNLKCVDNCIYVLSSNGELIVDKIIRLEDFLISCYESECYNTCIDLIEHYYPRILKTNRIIDNLYPLVEIDQKINLPSNTKTVISKIKRINYLKQKFSISPSGIYTLKKNVYVKKPYKLLKSNSLIMTIKSKTSKTLPRSKSLPNISFNLEKITKCQQSQPVNYSSTEERFSINQMYMEMNVPGMPFVSLATSDVFHDTLMELGSNVTNKIVQSSKTLKDTINSLTTSNKNNLVPYEVNDATIYSEPIPMNENEVDVTSYKLDLEHREKLNIFPILSVCKKLQTGQELDIECLQSLVDGVLEVKTSLENVLQAKQLNFPFKQYLKEKHFNTLKKAVNDSFEKQLVAKWANTYVKDTLSVDLYDYPEFLTHYMTEEDFKIDIKLSTFITLFAGILEVDNLLEFLLKNKLKCSYTIFSKILKLNSNNACKIEIPLLMYLNSMYVFLKLDQIESFCTLGYEKNIKPLFVFYLLMKFSAHLKSDILNKCNTIFLYYLSDLDKNVFDDCNILYYTIYSFIVTSNNKSPLCKCGFPLSNENGKFKKLGKMIVEYLSTANIDFDQLNKIFAKLVNENLTMNCLEDVIKCFCKEVPHLWPIVLESDFRLHSPKYSKVILSIHLNSIDQLELHLNNKSEELFDKMFTLNYYFKNGVCLSCGSVGEKNKGISWTDLAGLALKHLDMEIVRNLLTKHKKKIPLGDIDTWFYQSYVLMSLVDARLKTSVVETVKSNNNISAIGTKNCKIVMAALEEDKGANLKYEDLCTKKSHWGARIDLKNDFCIWCSLPLNSDPLIRGKNNGLVLFKCGHSFHTVCIRHQTNVVQCVVCQRK